MNDELYREADDHYDMAMEWIEQGIYEKAEDSLKNAIRCNPNFIYAYITLAEVYGRRKKYHDAVKILKEGRHRDPDFDRLSYLMAKYAYRAGDYRNALTFIDRAIEQNPSEFNETAKMIILRAFGERDR